MSDASRPADGRSNFLVVVDDTPESRVALRYACRRAKRTSGGVVLLRVLEPADYQHWMAVEKLMQDEAREEAEKLLQSLATEVNEWSGIMPQYIIRDGHKEDQVLATLNEDPSIRILVLGASPEKEGPGPLVSRLAGQLSGSLSVPITVVPGNMTPEQVEQIT